MRKASFRLLPLACLAALLLGASLGLAQEITVRPQPPTPPAVGEFRLEPLDRPDRVSIPEQEFRPEPQWTDHAPALIHPFTARARLAPRVALRFGLSAWTSPQELGAGVSSAERNGGVLAVGLTFVWGEPEEGPAPR